MSQAAIDRATAAIAAAQSKLDAMQSTFDADVNGLAQSLETALAPAGVVLTDTAQAILSSGGEAAEQ